MCATCDATGFTEETGCYWRGRRLEKIKNVASAELCRKQCQDHPESCHAYFYYKNGKCVLKRFEKNGEVLCATRTRKYIKTGRNCDAVEECQSKL